MIHRNYHLFHIKGVCRLFGLGHAHNEKHCSVTIDKTLRYEGIQIVICANYCRTWLTFLIVRVMYRTRTNNKKQ